jgi:pimeloyl-ACP methyl ester carboxylesterase
MKATVNGIETYYEVHGKEGAPWLVLSHSLACSVRMWDGEIARHKDNYRVLAYDTRGHGQSAAPKEPYTLEGLADDLHGLLKHLKIEHPHFVGLSMGGMIGQTFALKYPGAFQSMTLADTTSRYPAEAQAAWQERIRIVEAQGMAPLVQATLERWFTESFRKNQPDKVKRHFKTEGDPHAHAGDLRQRRCGDAAGDGARDPGKHSGGQAGADSTGGSSREHRAARRVQSRSCGFPFIPCQRESLAECRPKRSSARPTVCAIRSSIDFGMA